MRLHYRALVRGDRLERVIDGTRRFMGFYATIFIYESNEAEARLAALEKTRERLALIGRVTPQSQLRVEEIDVIDAGQVPEIAPGLVWFPENS